MYNLLIKIKRKQLMFFKKKLAPLPEKTIGNILYSYLGHKNINKSEFDDPINSSLGALPTTLIYHYWINGI